MKKLLGLCYIVCCAIARKPLSEEVSENWKYPCTTAFVFMAGLVIFIVACFVFFCKL